MNPRSTRAEIATLVLVVLGLAVAVFGVKLSGVSLFQKAPPTKELNVAQEKLEAAKKEAAEAQAKLKAAIDDQAAKTHDQVQGAQQYVEGARSSLNKAPSSPEVTLASGLLTRASMSLQRAIGDLPMDRQAEIMTIVVLALSEKQEEVDEAKEMLAQRDAENEVLQAQKLAVEAKIPPLQKRAEVAETKVTATEQVVKAKTSEVVAYANTAAEEKKKAGSLGALGDKLMTGIYVLAIAAIAFLLLWLYAKFRSVGVKTLGAIIGDIRSGVSPTQAFDTNLKPSMHEAVKEQSDITIAANSTTP